MTKSARYSPSCAKSALIRAIRLRISSSRAAWLAPAASRPLEVLGLPIHGHLEECDAERVSARIGRILGAPRSQK